MYPSNPELNANNVESTATASVASTAQAESTADAVTVACSTHTNSDCGGNTTTNTATTSGSITNTVTTPSRPATHLNPPGGLSSSPHAMTTMTTTSQEQIMSNSNNSSSHSPNIDSNDNNNSNNNNNNNSCNNPNAAGYKRSASMAFPDSKIQSSTLTHSLSSLSLPFPSGLSNPTGSSTGSDYSGNDDSFTNNVYPQAQVVYSQSQQPLFRPSSSMSSGPCPSSSCADGTAHGMLTAAAPGGGEGMSSQWNHSNADLTVQGGTTETVTNIDAATAAVTGAVTGAGAVTANGSNHLAPINRSGKNLTEKKIRRLEKNRLSARNCRRKKKEYTQNLQREIMMLEGENLRLRLQLQIGQEAEQTSIKEQEKVTEGIDELLKSGAPDSEIYNSIEMFKARFADYGRDRRSAIEFHLRNVERLLMPTTTTSVAMRALQGGSTGVAGVVGDSGECKDGNAVAKDGEPGNVNPNDDGDDNDHDDDDRHDSSLHVTMEGQDTVTTNVDPDVHPIDIDAQTHTDIDADADADTIAIQKNKHPKEVEGICQKKDQREETSKLNNTEPKELFQYLVNFLGVTPEQASALKDSRHVAKELDAALEKSLSMLRELRERLNDMGQDLDAEFSAIRSILTPRQAAKFLVWVANNGACMHMLNELWSKVYPEPIVGNHEEEEDE